jgi:hypothetical protein
MPNMSKRYGEDREVSGDGIEPAGPIGRLVFDLGKGPCQFVRFLKFKCGSAHRHQIVSAIRSNLNRGSGPWRVSAILRAFFGAARYLRLNGTLLPHSLRRPLLARADEVIE